MRCDGHLLSPKPEDTDNLKKLIMELKNENQVLKAENRKIREQLDRFLSTQEDLDEAGGRDYTAGMEKVTDKIKEDVLGFLTNVENKININIQSQLETMKIDILDSLKISKPNSTNRTENDDIGKTTYSQITKKKNILIVQPKNQQECEKTIGILHKEIKPEDFNIGITRVTKSKGGKIIISCRTDEDVNKIEERARQSIDETQYNIIKPKARYPQIKIVDLPENMDESTLKSCITKQNPGLTSVDDWKLIICKKMKKTHFAIFSVNPQSLSEVIKTGQLFVKWSSCRVFEYFNVFRCFSCGGFNHKSDECKESVKLCLQCGDAAHEGDCTKQKVCVNCVRANTKSNSNELNTGHSCYDHNTCELLKTQINMIREKTMYSIMS